MKIDNYSKIGINKIKQVNILEDGDIFKILDLTKELQRIFEVRQVFRTETEMRYSVLSHVKYPTPASKYWQSIREQNVFFTNLINISCDFEEKQGELELLEIELLEINKNDKRSNALIKIKHAQIKKTQFQLMEMRIIAKDQVREIVIWEKIKDELKKQGKFDINNVNTDQLESLQKRWESEFEISKLSNNKDLAKNSISGLRTIENDKKWI